MEPIELSMIAVDDDREATRGFDRLAERVLTVAAIYGANASGKSNVLEALAWLSSAVDHSLRQWTDYVPRQPFRFGAGPSSASTFEAEMMVGGVRYTYELEVDDSSIVAETLYSYPERRRRVLFERDEMNLSFRRGLSALSGTRELLTPTTLALSAALRFDDPEVGAFGRALAGVGSLNLGGPRRPDANSLAATRFVFQDAEDEVRDDFDARGLALGMLRLADLGIDDVEVERYGGGYRLRLVHRAGTQRLAFDIDDESAGTRTWFGVIGPVLHALRSGQILLVDEIDASLHPKLSAHLLTLFQDPHTNPRGAQLIFTTHDTSLLGQLNRDEVWLTEKGDDGATRLTALAEYGGDRVRRSTNLERAYLHGRFGAVPQVDMSTLRQSLGLAAGGE
ncbi:energy-coupling factor transporter ATP-binding protein EcfA2 [Actinoplanes tereljensis]|nr:ATP-binding protein [Actinoplanes tereljensis]